MKKILYMTVLTVFLLSGAIALTACGSSDTTGPTGPVSPTATQAAPTLETDVAREADTVLITDQGIDPVVFTVSAGTKVTWHNKDTRANSRHWMKALDSSFSTQAITYTARMGVTFHTPGTYDYRCIYHKDAEEEMGTIIVTE